MLLDLQNLLCDSQVPGAVGTTVSTNSIDLGAPDTVVAGFQARGAAINDMPVRFQELLVQVDATILASGGAATIDFQLISSASANLGTPTVLQTTGALSKAILLAGYQARLKIPPGITQRYLGLQMVVATNDITTGSVTAGLADAVQSTHPNG